MERDGFACTACGASERDHDVALEVDHIKPVSRFPDLEMDLDNLRTLCQRCHVRLGSKGSRRTRVASGKVSPDVQPLEEFA
jgi:5-methylcytosine-specific restriction endonuclease McrA